MSKNKCFCIKDIVFAIFTRFFLKICVFTKIIIEIVSPFVYNVFIAVLCTSVGTVGGKSLPERRFNTYVHS